MPIITIGNITVGGTGKTPHTEYLVDWLKDKYTIATLSRGYKRKTKGFIESKTSSTVAEVGDEPLQLKRKFPSITVAVDEKRVHGIEELLKKEKPPKIIILDDAFQHRHVKAGLNILLIDYNRPIHCDYMLPVGNLREPAHNCSRANIIIVTKCPADLKPIDFRILQKELEVFPYQDLFFTTFKYGDLKPVFKSNGQLSASQYANTTVLVVTGIANPQPVYAQLENNGVSIVKLKFPDHHAFNDGDIEKIVSAFNNIDTKDKIIVCTEKDAIRLKDMEKNNAIKQLPLYYLPIQVQFINGCDAQFQQVVAKYIGRFI